MYVSTAAGYFLLQHNWRLLSLTLQNPACIVGFYHAVAQWNHLSSIQQ